MHWFPETLHEISRWASDQVWLMSQDDKHPAFAVACLRGQREIAGAAQNPLRSTCRAPAGASGAGAGL
jgi:hypothetical protein